MTQPDNPYKPTGRHAYEAGLKHLRAHHAPDDDLPPAWDALTPADRAYWEAVTDGIQAVERARVTRRIEVLAHGAFAVHASDMTTLTAVYAQIYELCLIASHIGAAMPEGLPFKLPTLDELTGITDVATYPEPEREAAS